MLTGSCIPVSAPVAQRTEHRSSEPSVGGSNPSGSAWVGWRTGRTVPVPVRLRFPSKKGLIRVLLRSFALFRE